MSKAEPEAAEGGQALELDKIADELYGQRPDAFAAARDEQVRKARAEGRQPLARELARLRKPSQSAWLVNLLWRNQREVLEQFLQLGEEMTLAQAQASGPELLRLTAVRRELEAALVRGARTLAEQAGVAVSASMEREAQETLSAALAVSDVADEIRTGRLVKPASYAGFGTLGPSVSGPTMPSGERGQDREPTLLDTSRNKNRSPGEVSRRPTTEAGDAPRGTTTDESGPSRRAAASDADQLRAGKQPDERQARALARARERREAAERAVEDARAVFEAAAGTLAEQGAAADAAEQLHEALREQVDEVQAEVREIQKRLRELQERLRTLQPEAFAAEQAALSAAGRKAQAQRAHDAAVRTLARAEKELKDSEIA